MNQFKKLWNKVKQVMLIPLCWKNYFNNQNNLRLKMRLRKLINFLISINTNKNYNILCLIKKINFVIPKN